jgi:plastocyanin
MNTSSTAHRVRRALAQAAAVALAFGAALTLAAPATAAGEHRHVEISQYMYMPTSLTVEQGETVTWTNEDEVEHDVAVTSGPASFQSPMLAKGKSWSFTFSVVGPYSYICSVHPDMKATVTVKAKAIAVAPVTKAPAAPPAQAAGKAVGSPRAGKVAAAPKAAKGQDAADTSVAGAPQVISAPQSSATLQPLILVVGAAVMAVVFCLLLMASRPVALADEGVDPGTTPKHLDD